MICSNFKFFHRKMCFSDYYNFFMFQVHFHIFFLFFHFFYFFTFFTFFHMFSLFFSFFLYSNNFGSPSELIPRLCSKLALTTSSPFSAIISSIFRFPSKSVNQPKLSAITWLLLHFRHRQITTVLWYACFENS